MADWQSDGQRGRLWGGQTLSQCPAAGHSVLGEVRKEQQVRKTGLRLGSRGLATEILEAMIQTGGSGHLFMEGKSHVAGTI